MAACSHIPRIIEADGVVVVVIRGHRSMDVRIIICGSRNWTNKRTIHREIDRLLAKYGDELVIIQGGARGADTIATIYALDKNIKVCSYNADWETYGKRAGPIRNQRMIDEGKPQGVVAFDLGTSGTADMVSRSRNAGLPVIIYTS